MKLRALALLLSLLTAPPPAYAGAPRLVLQITVDQLRGDALERYRTRFGEGGFAALMRDGRVFTDAVHAHSNTETIVGHATLATGADPAVHGMVGNVWFDRGSGALHYNIEDSGHSLVGNDKGDAPADLARRIAGSAGRSPRAMLARTLADAMAAAYGTRAKLFAVSIKDRGAVPMAGFSGKAMWLSTNSGEFVSSTFYYPRLPAWAEEWNARGLAASYDGRSWELLHDVSTYRHAGHDDAPWEMSPEGYGRTFPHPRSRAAQKGSFFSMLAASPAGDELLADFAKTLLESEELGRDEIPDYLSVSFSSNDYVGHLFGPESLEAEDELLRLDRTLADLLAFVDARVGLAETLIVLSADHGAPEPAAQLAARGIDASTVLLSEVAKLPAVQALERKYGLKKPLIRAAWPPYLYLDRAALIGAGRSPEVVERELVDVLRRERGIAAVISTSDLAAGRVPDTALAAQARRNLHRQRSGDIYVVADPGWQLMESEALRKKIATIHGSPWRHDTWVPVIFAGPGVKPGMTTRRVHTTDVAPTIASLLGIKPPSRATGVVLEEVR